MEEISDDVFPMIFDDDHEYAKSSRGNSYGYALKNFEKDKSFVKKERFTQFLRLVNEKLKDYLHDDNALMLAGTNEDCAAFKRVSPFTQMVIGEISGSFNANMVGQLKQSVSDFFKGNKP